MTVPPRVSAGEVFQHFRGSPPLARARLSVLTGLSRAAATDRIRSLASRGLIGPTNEAPSTGGRPANQYRLMTNGVAVMSVKTIDCAVLVHGGTPGVLRTSKGAFGHTPVKGTSAKSTSVLACTCGIMNCLQAIAGEEAIIASLSADSKDEPDAISDAAWRTDPAAVSALRQAGRDIGETLLGSIHLLRPEVITVRTRWPGATDLLLAGLKEAVHAGGAPAVTENLVLASSRTGSPATGIALRAMDAGLAVEPVDHLLSAPPSLSGQQIRRPAQCIPPTASGRPS